MRRFVFFYFMGDDVAAIGAMVPDHVAYWKGQRLPHYQGGPFSDRSGGLITFAAADAAAAEQVVSEDPFVSAGALADHWVKEWHVE